MFSVTLFVSSLLLGAQQCSALVARASLPPTFTIQNLGFTTEVDTVYDDVSRDGGGGGFVNGHHLIVFSDTTTVNSNKQMIGFASNSVAFSDSSDPTTLTDFGSNGVPHLGIPWLANETSTTTELMNNGERLIIWPGSSITPLPGGVSGIAVYEVAQFPDPGADGFKYSTMVKYTPTANGPGAERLVDTLFYPGELRYGSFSSAMSKNGKNVLLFAQDSTGIHVARVPHGSIADRSQYVYWNGSTWSKTAPLPAASSTSPSPSSIVSDWCHLSSGDFIYSHYLKTWLLVYFNGCVDSTFYLRYSTSGAVIGPYTDAVKLYKTTPGRIYNYAAHAYGGYDPTGKSLVLSWTVNGTSTEMAQVTFG